MYGLHPLMPTKYIVLVTSGNERDSSMTILTNITTKFEKLQEDKMQVVKTIGIQQWNRTLWS